MKPKKMIEHVSFKPIPPQEQTDTISVIVACYNIEKFVERSILSLQAQTYRNLEILLIDDGSTDETGKICDRYAAGDERIRVIHKKNAGQGAARNTGLGLATGTYTTFLDGDDFIEPQMYDHMLGCIRRYHTDMAICRYRSVYVSDRKTEGVRRAENGEAYLEMQGEGTVNARVGEDAVCLMDRDETLFWLIAEDDRVVIQNAVWNKLCRTELIRSLRSPIHKYEDILFAAQFVAAANTVCYIDEPMHNYVQDRGTSCMNTSTMNKILTLQIPSYEDRDAFLISIGHEDYAVMHDYMVYKKLLLLYTQARRNLPRAESGPFMSALRQVLRKGCEGRFERLYTTPISDPHQELRMRLFLLHPWFYDRFMDLNDGVVLPLRQRIRARRASSR